MKYSLMYLKMVSRLKKEHNYAYKSTEVHHVKAKEEVESDRAENVMFLLHLGM